MEIKFTKKQYEDLIKMVYLGNWMINSVRFDNIVKKYDEIEQHIYSFAKDAGLDKYIEFNSKLNRFFPTIEFEDDEEIDEYIEEYDNAYFWDDLVSSLSKRDVIEKYGEKAIEKMTFDELLEKERPFVEKYKDEFEKNGVKNLKIVK